MSPKVKAPAARSEGEELMALHIRAERLPAPEREYRFAPPRFFRADFAWPAHRLLCEVDGGVWSNGRHVRPAGFAKRVAALLRESPMSRLELQRRLGITQQRASEALSDIGAQIIGREPRERFTRRMPIYGLDTPRQQSRIGAVSSVWQLGSMA